MAVHELFDEPLMSLWIWTYDELEPKFIQKVARTRELAGHRDTVFWLGDEERRFVLRGHGWRQYTYLLSGLDFEIAVGGPRNLPSVFVGARPTYIDRVGYEKAQAEIVTVIECYLVTSLTGFWPVINGTVAAEEVDGDATDDEAA